MSKRLWEVGEMSEGICEKCQKRVKTVFESRTFPMEVPRIDVPDVLVSVCTECNTIVGIPHQSTPAIADAIKKCAESNS